MNKNTLFYIIVLLIFVGGLTLRIRIIIDDFPFLLIGFAGGWYFRGRRKP